jgi:hypothetical protein
MAHQQETTMSRILYCLAALLLLATTSASALTEKSFCAYVVSIDASTKTVRFRVPDDATPPKWNEVAATWDDTTKWEDAPEKIYQKKSVDSNLVKKLQKDSKVYVNVSDRWSDEKTWWIQSLSTMPADASIP